MGMLRVGSDARGGAGYVPAVLAQTARPDPRRRLGLLVLETLDGALARGARAFMREICGFGMSSDAGHITGAVGRRRRSAMAAALRDAGMDASEVGYINTHGTGTPANDATETRAIRSVFAAPPPVGSTKSMHGHALGASPALEAVATILALRDGVLPPTANFTEPIPTATST